MFLAMIKRCYLLFICAFLSLFSFYGCGDDFLPDEENPVVCPGISYPKGAKLAKVWNSTGGERSLKYEFEYDSSGRLLKKRDMSGCIIEYQYDGHDRLVKEIQLVSNIDGVYRNLITYHYQYDEQGLLVKKISEYPLIGRQKETSCFYVDGRMSRMVVYDETGREAQCVDYEYDSDGLLIKEYMRPDSNSNMIRFTEYRNDNGLNVEATFYSVKEDGGAVLMRRVSRYYDSNGNLIMLVSDELSEISSMASYIEEYEYVSGD